MAQESERDLNRDVPLPEFSSKSTGRHIDTHLDDRIRMFEVGVMDSIAKALNETSSDAKAVGKTALAAVEGDPAAMQKIHETAQQYYAALSNPETYKKMVEAIGVNAGKLQIAMERGDDYGAGAIVGIGMAELTGPNKGKTLLNAAEDAMDAANGAHKVGKALDGELLPAEGVAHQQNLATAVGNDLAAQEPAVPKGKLEQAKEAMLHPYKTLLDKIDPPAPEIRLNRVAYEGKPTMMDNLNGNAQFLNDEHALQTARAQQISEAIKHGPPEVSERLGKAISNLDDKQIKILLSTDHFDEMLGITKGPRQLQQHAPFPGEDKLVNGMASPGEVKPQSTLGKVQEYILPQNPSKERMEKFASELEQGNFGNALKMQAESVAKGWVGLAGGSAVAAGAVVHHMNAEKEEKMALLSANERLAHTFESTAGNAKLEKEHPELKDAYAEYHKQVDDALKRHPGSDGRTSNEASSEIFRARQGIAEDLKNHGLDKPEQRSSIDSLSPEQKVTAAAQFIQSLPEHQRGVYQERVAEYANKAGLVVAETHTQERQVEQNAQREA